MSIAKVAVPTPDEIRQWPATVRVVPDVAAAFDIGPDTAYKMIRAGKFPVPVLRMGRGLRATRASVMSALGISEGPFGAPGNALATASFAQVEESSSHQRSEGRSDFRAA